MLDVWCRYTFGHVVYIQNNGLTINAIIHKDIEKNRSCRLVWVKYGMPLLLSFASTKCLSHVYLLILDKFAHWTHEVYRIGFSTILIFFFNTKKLLYSSVILGQSPWSVQIRSFTVVWLFWLLSTYPVLFYLAGYKCIWHHLYQIIWNLTGTLWQPPCHSPEYTPSIQDS